MADLVKAPPDRRASRLASTPERTEYLAFRLADETYAVKVEHVAEILKPVAITEVPRAPRNVLGIVGVRGRLVTVADLRRRLHVVQAPIERRTRILLADVGTGEQVGLLVDEVQQVWRLAQSEIEPAHVLGAEQPSHIAGIGRPEDGPLLILLELRAIVESP